MQLLLTLWINNLLIEHQSFLARHKDLDLLLYNTTHFKTPCEHDELRKIYWTIIILFKTKSMYIIIHLHMYY